MQSRRQIWFIIFCLLLFVLMSSPLLAQDQTQQQQPEPGYNPELLEELGHQNCAVPVSALGGQGHHISGVAADLTVTEPSAFTPPTLIEPDAPPMNDPGIVAILVVDSFSDQNGYDLTDLFSVTTQEEIADMVNDGRVTHGALVMNHINVLLESLGFQIIAKDPDWLLWERDDEHIVVMKVDAVTYGPIEPTPTPSPSTRTPEPRPTTSQDVKDAIVQVVKQSRQYDFGTEPPNRFVVNMSFALLPCTDVINFYNQGDSHSFDEYFNSIGKDYGNLIETTINLGDPLLSQFNNNDEVSADAWIGVASAGNSGLPFPFAPAIFPSIFSVGASPAPLDSTSSAPSKYANAGAFVENGGWIQLTKPAGLYGQNGTAHIFYLGSSFSGPALSTSLALELTHGVDIPCIYDNGHIPQVAYTKNEEEKIVDPNTPSSSIPGLLKSGIWGNLDLQEVRKDIC